MEGLCAVCGGLGAFKPDDDGNERYVKGDDCLENLKNLQRYMRRDNPETRDVFFELGKWNIVRHDLVPIILAYRADDELVLNAVKVMIFLTMPTDATSNNVPLQFEYLRGFKDAFLEQDAIGVIVTHLERPLEHLDSGATTEDDWKLVQLMLTLFRNLLSICDPPQQQQMAASNPQLQYLKDELLERLFRENVLDILLALVQHMGGSRAFLRHDNLLMVEIFHYIFWGQQPGTLASMEKVEKQASTSSGVLRALREKEKEQRRRKSNLKRCRSARFEGTYSQIGQDGSKGMLRDPFQSPLESMMRRPQVRRGPVKKVAQDEHHSQTCNADLLAHLKDFADQFVASGYNILMQAVKEDIRRERSGLQASDILTFFQVAEFFTSYHYAKQSIRQKQMKSKAISEEIIPSHGEHCGPIAATMDEDMFTLVISKWNEYAESGKDVSNWKSVNTAGALLKGMIRMLDNILKTVSPETKEGQREIRVARILLYKVFYDQTEHGILNFLLQLLKSFDIHKQPRRHLTDLVETTHVVLRLLESLTEEDGAVRVITKARNLSKRGKKQGGSVDHGDESSQVPKEQSKGVAEDQQQDLGVENQPTGQAVDGAAEVNLEDIPGDNVADAGLQLVIPAAVTTAETVEEEKPKVKEVSLDVKKFAGRFADNAVIRNYCWLLKHYKDNSPATNHYILRMLQRICNDNVLEPLLYQISVLRIFHEILSDGMVQTAEEYRALREFLTRVVRNVFKKLTEQPIMFVELLFWKTRGECHNITANHMLNKIGQDRRSLKRSRETYDALGDDEADVVPGTSDGISSKRRREAIDDALGEDEHSDVAENTKQAKQSLGDALGDGDLEAGIETEEVNTWLEDLREGTVKSKQPKRRGRSGPFTEEQEERIKDLFEQFKEKRSCLKLITEALCPEGSFSSAQVGRKLKQLGLQRDSRSGKKGHENEEDDTPLVQLKKISNDDGTGKRGRPRRLLDQRSLDAIKKYSSEADDFPLSNIRATRRIARATDEDTNEDDGDPLWHSLRMKATGAEAGTDETSADECVVVSTRQRQFPETNDFLAAEPTGICPSLRSILARKKRPKSGACGADIAPNGSPPGLDDGGIGSPRPAASEVLRSVATTVEGPGRTEFPKRRRLARKESSGGANLSEAGTDDLTISGVEDLGSEARQSRLTIVMSDSDGD